ncbi:MAG TPA: SBBP repeat-containing protein [Terriglobales bacterium]|nr:SBBP repeat-containing protein [Terriglobales bacterium]
MSKTLPSAFLGLTLTTAVALLSLPLTSTSAAAPRAADNGQKTAILQKFAQAPLTFEENRGQADAQARYIARGQGYSLFLTQDSAVLSLRAPERAATVRIHPAQPSAAMTIVAEGKTPTVSHYLVGAPSNWHRNIAQYERVRYRGVYPGVDLVYYGNQRQLEHDFVVAPGADPRSIRVQIDGVQRLATNAGGDLVLHTSAGDALLERPVIYQERAGKREPVDGSYRIVAGNAIAFDLGSYDRSRELVIDPVLSYATLLGGGNSDTGMGVAIDSSLGYAFITGNTGSDNFPVTANAYDKTCASGTCNTGHGTVGDAFVAKISLTGTRLYVTYLGGSDNDVGAAIAAVAGNAYVTGNTWSDDFPGTNIGTFQTGSVHAFVTKLSTDGSSLVYSARFGNSSRLVGGGATDIAVDSAGVATVTGTIADLATTAGSFQTTFGGGDSDAFVARINAGGTAFTWATYLGGSGRDDASGVVLDAGGNAYVSGATNSSNFPTTAGSLQPTYNSANGTAFVTKVKADGSGLVYSTFLGGTTNEFASSVAVDASGNAYVAGSTSSPDFPTTAGAYNRTYNCGFNCGGNGFVAKLNSTGSALVYSTLLFVTGPTGIAVDSQGQAYVGGTILTQDFGIPTTMTAFQRVAGRPSDGFLIKLNAAGSGVIYASYLGGHGSNYINDIAVDANGNVTMVGYTDSATFPATPGAFMTTNAARDFDAFVARAVALCALNKVNQTITMCQPADGSTLPSPVTIVAGTFDNTRVASMQVLVDGTLVYSAGLSAVEIRWKMAAGPHTITVTATDTGGVTFQKTISITVGP